MSVSSIISSCDDHAPSATHVIIGDLIYNLNGYHETAEVTFFANQSGNSYYVKGDLVIPETVSYGDNIYTVTSIGERAFESCIDLKRVVLPNSVKSIGKRAFSYCSGLTSVAMPKSLVTIEELAFWNCYELRSIDIPSLVTKIGIRAFEGCNGLTRVDISDLEAWCKVEFEGYNANPLANGNHLYLNGKEITDLKIPNSITNIGQYAFLECDGLTSVEIPNSVTTIGPYAFYGCVNLTYIVLGENLREMGSVAFLGSRLIKEIVCKSEEPPTGSYQVFSTEAYDNATVFVPENSIATYRLSQPWIRFSNIKKMQ